MPIPNPAKRLETDCLFFLLLPMALRSKFAIEINNILVKQAFYILNWHFDLSPLKRQSPDPLKYYCTDHARKRKRKDKELIKKSRTCRFVVISDGHSLVKSYFFWEILGKRKTPFLLFLCYTLRRLYFITWAERQVKDSRRSGMSQSSFFETRLGTQSSWVFSLSWLFDEVRAEFARDISRSLRVT